MGDGTSENQAPSTLQAYVDAGAGAVQSALGSLTGRGDAQAAGEARRDGARAEHEASQAALRLPGATVSSAGGVSGDDAARSEGSHKQTVGSAKEALGGLVGSEVGGRRRQGRAAG